MSINLNRRRFLLTTGMGTLTWIIPRQVISNTIASLYQGHVDPGKEFSLLKMERILPEYNFPFINSFSTDAFRSNFTLYNFYQEFVVTAGTFEISKKSAADPLYQITCYRKASADIIVDDDSYKSIFRGNYIFQGKITTRDDLLASPVSWECETKISDQTDGSPYMNTLHRWKGSFKNGRIYFKSGSNHLTKIPASKNLTWKWGIINLVQKMAEQSVREIHFSALDEMDNLYEHQFARFRKKQLVDCGFGNLEFSVFEVLGDGIIPTVYWVDNFNRIVFIITGVEAYVLSGNS
jgi:hypothetical protein